MSDWIYAVASVSDCGSSLVEPEFALRRMGSQARTSPDILQLRRLQDDASHHQAYIGQYYRLQPRPDEL